MRRGFFAGITSVIFFLIIAIVVLHTAIADRAGDNSIGGEMEMIVKSSAFGNGGMIPKKYTADGENASPPIAWAKAPGDAKSFVLICDDPDAPAKVWVHWVIYDIPANMDSLPEAVPAKEILDSGAKQGTNDFGKIGYCGPAPPSGIHRYYFKVYALDTVLDFTPGKTKANVEKAMEGHVLASGELMGKYTREK